MIHILREMEWEGMSYHLNTQNSVQVKTYGLSISQNFQFIFLNHAWPQVTETVKTSYR